MQSQELIASVPFEFHMECACGVRPCSLMYTRQAALLASLEEDAAPAPATSATKAKPKKKGKRSKAAASASLAAAASLAPPADQASSPAATSSVECQAMQLLQATVSDGTALSGTLAVVSGDAVDLPRSAAASAPSGRDCDVQARRGSVLDHGGDGEMVDGPRNRMGAGCEGQRIAQVRGPRASR